MAPLARGTLFTRILLCGLLAAWAPPSPMDAARLGRDGHLAVFDEPPLKFVCGPGGHR